MVTRKNGAQRRVYHVSILFQNIAFLDMFPVHVNSAEDSWRHLILAQAITSGINIFIYTKTKFSVFKCVSAHKMDATATRANWSGNTLESGL